MMNQEDSNVTTSTPKASLLLMEENLCKRESAISRNNSKVEVSSRMFYYYHDDIGVPFTWEMQPGTPINLPPSDEIIPPITPPPAMLSRTLPKPSVSLAAESNKHSNYFPANLKLWRWKNLRKKYFSRGSSSSQRMLNNNGREKDSKSCGELERFGESEDYRSSSLSSSSSLNSKTSTSSTPQVFHGCAPCSFSRLHIR